MLEHISAAVWPSKQWADLDQSLPDVGSHKATGLLGGIQGGYNWQIGHLVLGVEGQYSFANLNGDHGITSLIAFSSTDINTGDQTVFSGTLVDRFSTKVDGIATIAGRIGFASDPIDRTLFYATGGAAFAKDKYALQTVGAGLECFTPSGGSSTCSLVGSNFSLSGSQNRWGWIVGAGLEHGLTENLSANVEYNYLDFGKKTVSLQGNGCSFTLGVPDCGPVTRNFNVNQNIQLIKFGINYRFNWGDH